MSPSVIISHKGGYEMDYLDLRDKFVELSGRYDLVKPDRQDNGADFFINAGQKMLDRSQDQGKSRARLVRTLTTGDILITTVGLRAIKEVWITSSDGRSALSFMSIAGMRDYYGKALSSVDRGTPEYYAPALIRPYPDTLVDSGQLDIEDLIMYNIGAGTGHFTYGGLIIMPPSSIDLTISVLGLFYSPTLSATLANSVWTQTKSFWTEEFPDTLLLAALYKLEAFYRNTEGAKDWQNALTVDLTGMDNDFVEEDLNTKSQMGG